MNDKKLRTLFWKIPLIESFREHGKKEKGQTPKQNLPQHSWGLHLCWDAAGCCYTKLATEVPKLPLSEKAMILPGAWDLMDSQPPVFSKQPHTYGLHWHAEIHAIDLSPLWLHNTRFLPQELKKGLCTWKLLSFFFFFLFNCIKKSSSGKTLPASGVQKMKHTSLRRKALLTGAQPLPTGKSTGSHWERSPCNKQGTLSAQIPLKAACTAKAGVVQGSGVPVP